MIEVAKAAEEVRRKFDRPAAEATSCGSTDDSVSPVPGTKKKGMAKPWTRNGRAMAQKFMSDVKWVRQKVTPAIQATPNEIRKRMSTLPINRATIGDIITARTP